MTERGLCRKAAARGRAFISSAMLFAAISLICLIGRAEATPLFSMQAAEKCDMCHEMPDPSDPKWIEENYKLSLRQCRLSCGACHENPSGGMLRTDGGFYFGTKTLPLVKDIRGRIQSSVEKINSIDFLSLGGDFRFMSLYDDNKDDNPSYFPMQGDLYLKADVHENISFMTQFGLERGGNAAVREAFGLVENMPYNSYVKLGKFLPPFGHRLEDHTVYTRSKIAFDHSFADSYYSGVEIGAEPLVLFARAAYFNEDAVPKANTEFSRRGGSGVIGWSGLWLHLGASYMRIKNFETSIDSSTDRSAYGVFGALRAKEVPYLERLTYLFEYDIRKDEIGVRGLSDTDEEAEIMYHELDYRLTDGINIKLRYEAFDPDDESDEVELQRYTAGLDFFPYPFTEVTAQYRYEQEDPGDADNNRFLFMAHIWF